MKSKHHPSIRLLGQRSLSSTFLLGSSHRTADCKEDVQNNNNNANDRYSRVSLSDFLNRRLHKSTVLPTSVQGKERPFSSPVNGGKLKGSIEEGKDDKNRGETEVNGVLDIAFEQLKQTRKEKEDCVDLCTNGELGSSSSNEMQESRKRRNPFEVQGTNGIQSSRKALVVLGDDPKPIYKRRLTSFSRKEKPRPIYNHYANGSGWWDCNMEGVDSDEVGCHEMWEGVGSTTLGGLEWH
ncbi:hypothetical protein LguiB_026221 [Lonicera macranthoides]